MIPVNKIPLKLDIEHWTCGGTYISDSAGASEEYTWYREGKKDTSDPHISVVKKSSGHHKDADKQSTGAGVVTYQGNSATVTTYRGLDGSAGSEKKVWLLRKFHISIPLGSGSSTANGHLFYRVASAQHVEYCGDNAKFLREELRAIFLQKTNLYVNTWHALALGFYQAAIKDYREPNASFMPMQRVLPPPTVTVGPQTSAAFDAEHGL
jgi:hypothetical protein